VADLAGQRVVVGHAFWFRVIQYYGDSSNSKERYGRLFEYCNLAADLNPHYLPIYLFGAAPLAFHVHRPGEAVRLLERGIRANPEADRLKLLLAAIAYRNRSEWDKVIPLLEAQVSAGGAPTMMVNILANTYKSAGRYDDAVRLWRTIQREAATDEQRITAAAKLRELYTLMRRPQGARR
jgi:tetratricopeptide (TPR) repeat protein